MRTITRICTSKVFILSSFFAGFVIPKLSAAATSARLGVSAIVATTCNVKVRDTTNGRVETDSTCSDASKPTIVLGAPANPTAPSIPARRDEPARDVQPAGSPPTTNVTVTY